MRETKANIVNQQYVVYIFKCDLCDAGYVGYKKGHWQSHVDSHRQKRSAEEMQEQAWLFNIWNAVY